MSESQSNTSSIGSAPTVLITYVYFETPLSKINLQFFINNGVFKTTNAHYHFIIKGNDCSVHIPQQPNISVYNTVNKGYDFAAYTYSIEHTKKPYDYYVFLNDTVRGPFVPRYVPKSCWYSLFTQLINENTKLVGASINRQEYNNTPKHVQSMCFATDFKGIQLLQNKHIFDIERNIEVFDTFGKVEYIMQFEVGMSKVFLEAGYSIDSLMQVENNPIELQHGDVHYKHKYFGITLNPLEIMFIKVNRIDDSVVLNYTTWNSEK